MVMRMFSVLVFLALGGFGFAGITAQGVASEKKPAKADPNDEPAQTPVFEGLERKEYEVVFHLIDAKDKPVIADEHAGRVGAVFLSRVYGHESWPVAVRRNADRIEAKLVPGKYKLSAEVGYYGVVRHEFEVSDADVSDTLKTPYWRRVVECVMQDQDGTKLTYTHFQPRYAPKKRPEHKWHSIAYPPYRLQLPLFENVSRGMGGRVGGRAGFRGRGQKHVDPYRQPVYKTEEGSFWVVVFAGCESAIELDKPIDALGDHWEELSIKHDYDTTLVDLKNDKITIELTLEPDQHIQYNSDGYVVVNKDDVGFKSRKVAPDASKFRRPKSTNPVSKTGEPIRVELSRTADVALVRTSVFRSKYTHREGGRVWFSFDDEDAKEVELSLFSRGYVTRETWRRGRTDKERYDILAHHGEFFAHHIQHRFDSKDAAHKGFTLDGVFFRVVNRNGHGIPLSEAVIVPLSEKSAVQAVFEFEKERSENGDRHRLTSAEVARLLKIDSDSSDETIEDALLGIRGDPYNSLKTRDARLYFCKHGTWYDPWTQMRGDTDGYFIAPDQRMEKGKKYALYVWTKSTDDLEPDYRFVFEGQGETTDLGCITLKDD